MQIPAIKALLKVDIDALKAAEEALGEEQEPAIEIKGVDEGEKLTHVFGAIWVKEQVAKGEMNEREALRAFTQKVRNSIS